MRYLVAFCASLVMSLLLGPMAIPLLRRLRLGQRIRSDGPRSHLAKAGTPTMGGVVFLAAAAVGIVSALVGDTVAWRSGQGARDAASLLIASCVTAGFAAIGLGDDLLKVVHARPLGLRARDKLFGQVLLGLALGAAADRFAGLGTWARVPFSSVVIDLGAWYAPFVSFMTVAESNAVNLTDGLDGLATGACAISFGTYAVVAALRGSTAMAVFSLAFMGALVGFLRYNVHPAQVFMGDTGSMGLGAALACAAVLTKTELYLAVIGGLYAVEAASVALQVIWFRTTGRRIFRMSPLHHHFELQGWPEEAVVSRFWLGSLFFGAAGLLALVIPRS